VKVARVQKVVMRKKMRRQRWRIFRDRALKFLKYSVFGSFILVSTAFIYHFLFITDFFMIKTFEILPQDTNWSDKISATASSLQGASILTASLKEMEQELSDTMKELSSISISRSFPDTLKFRYTLRKPVAYLRTKGRIAVVDGDGIIFPQTRLGRPLPLLIVKSTRSISTGIGFIKMWTASDGPSLVWSSTSSLRKIALDSMDEISVYSDGGTRVVWGQYEPSTFSEKYRRFSEVWSDLKKRSIRVRYINLRGVPQRNNLVLGDREVAGRVIVRPETGNTVN